MEPARRFRFPLAALPPALPVVAAAALGLAVALGAGAPARAAGESIAGPGECATPRPHVALYTTPLDGSRVATTGTAPSDLSDVLGPANERFDPNDVAAGPDVGSFSPPPPPSPAPPNPCSGVCVGPGGTFSSPPPPVAPRPPAVVESPPVFRPPPGLPIRPTP
jgi:hypothetical protein